uniref:VHS domain-containing protein n=1 Tax=Hanusia phi TaxID=3032 RepID=A0A7S0HGY9_9CRYP
MAGPLAARQEEVRMLRMLHVCDSVNVGGRAMAQQVVKALRARVSETNPAVQLAALELAEVLVKNCGSELHQQVGSKHFMSDLQSIATEQGSDPAVQRKALELIQAWGEAFKSLDQTLPLFAATLNLLKAQGVEFPPPDPSLAPQLLGQLDAGRGRATYGVMAAGAPAASEGERQEAFMADRLREDLEQVKVQCNLLVDMLNEAIVMKQDIRKNNILTELVRNCRIFQPRIMRLTEQVPDEGVIPELLKVNDELITALNVYSSTLLEVTQRQKKSADQTARKTILWEPEGAVTEEDVNLSMLLGMDKSESLIPPPPSKTKPPTSEARDELDVLLGIDKPPMPADSPSPWQEERSLPATQTFRSPTSGEEPTDLTEEEAQTGADAKEEQELVAVGGGK